VVKIHVEIFWVVTPCSVVAVYQCFGEPYYLHLQGEVHRGSKVLRYIGILPPTLRGVTTQKTPTWIISWFLFQFCWIWYMPWHFRCLNWVMWPDYKADYTPSCSVKVTNEKILPLHHLNAFMAWCIGTGITLPLPN